MPSSGAVVVVAIGASLEVLEAFDLFFNLLDSDTVDGGTKYGSRSKSVFNEWSDNNKT